MPPPLQTRAIATVLMLGVGLVQAGAFRPPTQAQDWPQMLGPSRDGVYAGPPLADSWPAAGPRVVWRRNAGHGLSGPVVVGNRVILFHRAGNREVVEAMNAATGVSEWRYDYPTAYRDDFGFDDGPRAVPVVADGAIYTFGAEGQLHAIDLATGRARWHVDTMKTYRVPKNFFGTGGSPVVDGGRVIANVGGPAAGIVAFDARTGRELWTATKDGASYSSGVVATVNGERLAVFLTRAGVVGLAPATGDVVLQRPWRARSASSVNAASPLVIGNTLFVSAEYGPGAGAFRMAGGTLTELWSSNDVLSNHYATSVHRDGILYGYHGRQELGPSLRAVELATGKVRWTVDGFRAGSITLAGNRLVLVRESGELVIADATPERFRQLIAAKVMPPTVRALPAIAAGYMYLRNDDTLMCLDLRASR
ncbi:MAG: PQQ-binding-like beta-propeller repeat protein [Vicinamibacterales bacterium]